MSSEARHLHPAAMLIGAVKTLRRWIGFLAAGGAAAIFSGGTRMSVFLVLGVVLVVAGSAVWGFLSWRATRYWTSSGAFHLRQGVLQKNERTIPLEHVQSVDTVQGVIQRLFQVVEVRIETAGGGTADTDASLSALDRDAADLLRGELEGARPEVSEEEEEAGPTVLRRLGTRDLLIAGATSGQIGVALSLVAIGSQFFDNFVSERFFERVYESVAPGSILALAAIALAVGLFAWLLAIGGTVLAYAGFTLSREGDFLYIKRGLLEKREATIPLARIQAVRIVEGVLRQPFGLALIRVESAGYGAGTEDVAVSTTIFPLLPRAEAADLLKEAAPEFAVEPELRPLPRRSLRRYVFRSTILVLLIAIVAGVQFAFALDSILAGFSFLPLCIPAALYGWLRWRDAGWEVVDDRLVARSRTLGRTTSIAPRWRLQSRSVVRSPFQRRARLATFRARVASSGGGTEINVVDLESISAFGLLRLLGPRR
ncbi:MAG TPA: PH domain-containing protein [Rubrobacteraceae bacterium]|nr:PH domain-containing protein [Rubrobacteraceae bacterium]